MSYGQGLLGDNFFGKWFPVFTFKLSNNIFSCRFTSAKRICSKTRPFNITDGKNSFVSGEVSLICFHPCGTSNCKCFYSVRQEFQCGNITNGDDNSLSRNDFTRIHHKTFSSHLFGHYGPAKFSTKCFSGFLFFTECKRFLNINKCYFFSAKTIGFAGNITTNISSSNDNNFFANCFRIRAFGFL